MTIENRHWKNFRRELAAMGVSSSTAVLAETAILKPSAGQLLGTFFGANASILAEIVSTAENATLAMPAATGNGCWGLGFYTDDDGEIFEGLFFFSFDAAADGSWSVARFTLSDESVANEIAKKGSWEYVH